MTDKQIIVNGIDVSGCEFYCDGCCTELTDSYGDYIDKCTEFNNCYYKQLKRKEQECDMWKNLTIDNGAVALKYQQQLDQLKAENEELKKCYKNNSALLDFEETNTTKLVNKVMKLEKALAEIKEIAEEQCNICETLTPIDEYKNCKICKQGIILQKISECEGK